MRNIKNFVCKGYKTNVIILVDHKQSENVICGKNNLRTNLVALTNPGMFIYFLDKVCLPRKTVEFWVTIYLFMMSWEASLIVSSPENIFLRLILSLQNVRKTFNKRNFQQFNGND